ncbi:hypothetical protein VdG1_02910 [Verticillium dahliae VDG1]|nr:hypothetical protein VdG1_02910 [Verticillium dahliae VDG1]
MASHAAAASAPTDIHIVTLNCWGLKYISKQRPQRLAEIARRLALADPAPHIVALQECFVHDDYLAIRRATRHGLLALLFFPAELRALREFEWDVLNARAAALGGGEGPGALDEDDHLDLVDDKL